jgi:anti-sigma factor (TIGR02949 family)
MDDCRRTAGRVTPYVDGALPEPERAEVERHLDACPPCRRGAEQEQRGRAVLRECAGRLKAEPLPPGLRSRCESIARDHARPGGLSWLRVLVPLAAMVVLVLFAGVLLFSIATRRSDALLAAQLTADHVKCFEVFEPGEGGPADATRVAHDLESRYGWAMRVPPTSGDITLIGGRRCLYAEGTMPHVMYRARNAAPVSLFRLDGVSRPPADLTALGHRCRIWSRDGYTYVLVMPDRETPEMTRLVSYVQAEAR